MTKQQRTLEERKKQWRQDVCRLNDRAEESAWNLIEHDPKPADLQLVIEDIDDEGIVKQAAARVFKLDTSDVLCLKAVCHEIPEMREEVYEHVLKQPTAKVLTMVTQYCEDEDTLDRIWGLLRSLGPSDTQLRVIAEWSAYLRDRANDRRKQRRKTSAVTSELEELDAEMFCQYFEPL